MNLKRVLALSIISAIFSSSAFAVTEQRIAVIDINKVVLASPQVKALSKSQSLKAEEIKKFVKSVQENISKQKDENVKKELITKYEKELTAKKEANANEYNTKLKELDKNIKEVIAQKAKSMGYTMVIVKNTVISSSDDITQEVIKVIK